MTEKMARPCWDPKDGSIKWISHPNGPPQYRHPSECWCRTCRLPGHLSANHKGALGAMVAEVAKYAGGVTHSLVFTPHLEVFHTGKLLVPGIEIR